jgi:hypothetical protein
VLPRVERRADLRGVMGGTLVEVDEAEVEEAVGASVFLCCDE